MTGPTISSARRRAPSSRRGGTSLGGALRWLVAGGLAALLAWSVFRVGGVLATSSNVSANLRHAVALLAAGLLVLLVARWRFGRVSAWLVVPVIGLSVLTFLLGVVDLVGFMGSEKGREVLIRLAKIQPGEELRLSREELAGVSTFRQEIEGFIEIHERIREIYRRTIDGVLRLKQGRRGPVIREAALVDPLDRARTVGTLKEIERLAAAAREDLRGLRREVRRRYARRCPNGRWKPKNYGASVIVHHVEMAESMMGAYGDAVSGALRFLNEIRPGEVGFGDGELLASREEMTRTSMSYDFEMAVSIQRQFAGMACCPLGDIQIVPELRVPVPGFS